MTVSAADRYIFLDVDGNLNSLRTLIAFGDYLPQSLDPVAVALVNTLCDELQRAGYVPKVVISSTWRRAHPDISWWQDLLGREGSALHVEGMLPVSTDTEQRGKLIEDYLDALDAPYAVWVALDDRSIGDAYADRRVGVDPAIGLTHDNINEAFQLLTSEDLLPASLDHVNKWAGMRLWNRRKGKA